MTTAHRPTFDPARGREARRGPAYHQRLQPSHTHLKTRQADQGGVGGLASTTDSAAAVAQPRDLRAELLAAERAVKARREGKSEEEIEAEAAAASGATQEAADRSGNDGAAEEDPEQARRRLILEQAAEVDADSTGSVSDADSDAASDADSDAEDSDDEEAELLRELAKIKAERAAVRAKEEAARAAAETEAREVEIARGNPLLNGPGGAQFGVKRRWDDDVVFKNQARGTETRGKEGAFVNDLLRSDFHKRFMSRYVR